MTTHLSIMQRRPKLVLATFLIVCFAILLAGHRDDFKSDAGRPSLLLAGAIPRYSRVGTQHGHTSALLFILTATTVTLSLGEIGIRVIASQRLIYNVEMVKYAKELKVRDPLNEVSHLRRSLSS